MLRKVSAPEPDTERLYCPGPSSPIYEGAGARVKKWINMERGLFRGKGSNEGTNYYW